MRLCLPVLAGICLLQPALAHAQAAQAAKPQAPVQTPAQPSAQKPVPERKEIKVPEKVLKTYVGEYELAPERILTITFEDGSLYGQPTGQEKRQMFAETQNKFFLKVADVQLTFNKDPKGTVVGMTMEQAGRPTRELKKIK